MSGRFELRQDDDTGRRYWFGGEDGWKDPTEVGANGVLTVSAEHFKVGTVLVFTEPAAADAELGYYLGICDGCAQSLNECLCRV